MPRRSGTTARVVAVLEFLTDRPDETFGLSELARELDINKATLLTVVTTLIDAGWLLQHPKRKTYGLGPRVIAAGAAARQRFPDTTLARPHLERVAADLGCGCVIVGVSDAQMVVLDRAGFADPLHGLTRLGVRMSFAPPYGLALAAWFPPERYEVWQANATPSVESAERAVLREAVRLAHERGFVIGGDLPAGHELDRSVHDLRLSSHDTDPALLAELGRALRATGYYLGELQDDDSYRANHVSAPVRTTTGVPEIALMVPLYSGETKGSQLAAIGARLAEAGAQIAEEMAAEAAEGR
ncbi:hypothetical protein EFK50_09760 [Nocardioides marmoriginsengisoli]|uniref:IclR family transcriptional regulator n=1 Tax=Nocardioides marmoriginsengisoli TaxID=661483 RepID=A0A3N0CFS7_9ACTN|nr:helix-turn-helix domain-containing protein [Nocardioides marmoriginsengisoli]RNL62091.1 hypothetical protein EFK50_09760 [Nocardioides marmoriginsengisoli]